MSAPRIMFEKIWARHVVAEGPGGHALLYIDRHLLHEGTTAAFGRLARSGRRVRRRDLSFATADHYLLTSLGTPTSDAETRGMVEALGRHTAALERQAPNGPRRRIGPHVFRHTTAMHLLEAGVEVNVIRGWLGHVSLDTTHRYAEINVRAKEAALRTCEPPSEASAAFPRTAVWRTDETLLAWLNAL